MKFYKKDWFLKVVSLVIAVVLWMYVVYQTNPEYNEWLRDIPITYTNATEDFNTGKLTVIKDEGINIDVKIRGTRRTLVSVDESSVTASVDLSSIEKSGVYSLPVKLAFEVQGIDVIDKNPATIEVHVDDVVTKEMEVAIEEKGTVKEGYEAERVNEETSKLKLTGPKTLLENVKKAAVTVDLSGATEDITGLYKVKLYDVGGNEYSHEKIRTNIEYIDVKYDVYRIKELPVTAVLLSNVNSFGHTVEIQHITPDTVKVKGDESKIDALTEIKTMPIDVTMIMEDIQTEVLLEHIEGVEFVGTDEKVKINLRVVK